MSGPTRLRSQARSELRRVLASSALDEPPPQALKQTLLAVGVVTATSGAVAALGAAASSQGGTSSVAGTGVWLLAKWLGVGMVVGVVGVGAVEGAALVSSPSPVPAAPGAASAQVFPESSAPVWVAPPSLAEPPHAPLPTPRYSSATHEPTRAIPPPLVSSLPVTTPLELEMQELERVRQAIAQHRPAEALTRLDVFASQHPRAKLSEEASILRIEALMASGATSEAKHRASMFLALHPNSAFSDRLRTLTLSVPPDSSVREDQSRPAPP